jgi:hypothetical protein
MKLFEIIFGNIVTLYLGAIVRYIYIKYIKNSKDVKFKHLLKTKKNIASKDTEINNFENEMSNRITGGITLFAIIFILWFFFLR